MIAAPASSRQELWRTVLALHPWERVVDVAASNSVPAVTLADLLGESTGSVCVKVDGAGFDGAVRAGAGRTLDRIEHWAVMVEAQRLHPGELAEWAARDPAYLLDHRTGRLVRVPGGLVDLTAYMLESGWLHPRDCLLTSPAVAETIARLS